TGLVNASALSMERAAPTMHMNMKAATGAPAIPMCDKCMKGGQAAHTCSNVCIGVQAVLPSVCVSPVAMQVRLSPRQEQDCESAVGPPDPPPPKLSLLA